MPTVVVTFKNAASYGTGLPRLLATGGVSIVSVDDLLLEATVRTDDPRLLQGIPGAQLMLVIGVA